LEGTPTDERVFLETLFLGRVIMKNLVVRFVKDESGATAIEYGLIAAGIGVAIVTVVGGVGDELNTLFTTVQTELKP
jgi:pilus assembly protein Flp/PilA